MKKRVLITGSSGVLGGAVVESLEKTGNFIVRVILRDKPANRALSARFSALYGQNVEIIMGDVLDYATCVAAVTDIDYVLHFAAVVPPLSNHKPELAEKTNYFGTKNLVDAIAASKRGAEVRFVEVGSMSEYGNRDYHHPWARVGDPLIPSSFDCYAVTKIRAERYVVESGLKYWVGLRVAGILYENILWDNISDGLMFYTPLNAPIEMITLNDTVALFRNMLTFDSDGTLDASFWRRIYNVGGGYGARTTGYGLFEMGFKLMGSKPEKLLEPHWLPVRNYFTTWYYDDTVLNDYLKFQSEDLEGFFDKIKRSHTYFKLGKPLSPVIKRVVIERTMKTPNSPMYWVENGMKDRVQAFFGGYDEWGNLPRKWDKYPVFEHGKVLNINGGVETVDYKLISDKNNVSKNWLLSHGYDDTKADSALGYYDFCEAAEFRGGKCLSKDARVGDLHTMLNWQCHNGHVFKATAYGVLKAGYWCKECCTPAPWDFDSLAKRVPYYAQIWYDTHGRDEGIKLSANCYYDIPRADNATPELPPDKIKKYRKG